MAHVRLARFLRLSLRSDAHPPEKLLNSAACGGSDEVAEVEAATESGEDHRMGKFPQLRDFAIADVLANLSHTYTVYDILR